MAINLAGFGNGNALFGAVCNPEFLIMALARSGNGAHKPGVRSRSLPKLRRSLNCRQGLALPAWHSFRHVPAAPGKGSVHPRSRVRNPFPVRLLSAKKFAFSSGAGVLNFNNGTGEERVGTEACCTLPARAHCCAEQPCQSGLVRSM
jgi:hypothetical protein